MKLKEYLKKENLTDAAFARKVGLSKSTISKIKNHFPQQKMSIETAYKIYMHSNQEILFSDICGKPWLEITS
jgi:DNA-binding XRE family transcriptional regulator